MGKEEKKEKRRNGEGSFRELPNGKVLLKMQYGYNPNGNPRIISVTGSSKTDCIRRMKEKERDLDLKWTIDDVGDLTLTELCRMHLEEDRKRVDYIKPTSGDRRECTINNQIAHYEIGRKKAKAVTHIEIRNHIEFLLRSGLSVSTVDKAYLVIYSAYNWAIKDDRLSIKNPCDRIHKEMLDRFTKLSRRDSAKGVVRVLSVEQEQIAISKARETWSNGVPRYNAGIAMEFLSEVPIRCGEECALKLRHWSRNSHLLDIAETRHLIKNKSGKENDPKYIPYEDIVKNAHRRTIEISDEAQAILESIVEKRGNMGPDDYFFVNDYGKPTEPSALGSCFNRIFKSAGLKIDHKSKVPGDDISGAHIFRRTYATRKYHEGCRVEDIAAYLGDEPATVLKYYIERTEKIMEGDEVKNIVRIPQNKSKNDVRYQISQN